MKHDVVGVTDKKCVRCTLPDNFPGIHFNSSGVCNYCIDYDQSKNKKDKKADYRLKFESLVQKYKGTSSYDALMCYSGGKDSTFTLTILKEKYNLNVLAFTFDNGFVPLQTLTNIHNVVENLGIDHTTIKPRFDMLAKIFIYCTKNKIYSPKALDRSSTICTSCMGFIKYSALRLAIENDIPFIVYGWSPGQAPIHSSILMNTPEMVRMMQKSIYKQLYQIAGDAIRPYFLEERHFEKANNFPININPLAFLSYDLTTIYKSIKRFHWQKPENTDANSTNCLLNSFANEVHKQQFGYHPYAFEMANLVREGYIDRNTAIQRLNQPENLQIVNMVKQKLKWKKISI